MAVENGYSNDELLKFAAHTNQITRTRDYLSSICSVDGQASTFKVKGDILISLREEGRRAYPISGAPFSNDGLVAAQGLNAHFGTPDHKKRKRSGVDGEGTIAKRRKPFHAS